MKLPETALPSVEFIIERFIAEFLTLFMLLIDFYDFPELTDRSGSSNEKQLVLCSCFETKKRPKTRKTYEVTKKSLSLSKTSEKSPDLEARNHNFSTGVVRP